jgi:hypothetical protein
VEPRDFIEERDELERWRRLALLSFSSADRFKGGHDWASDEALYEVRREEDLGEFRRDRPRKDGRYPQCRTCEKEWRESKRRAPQGVPPRLEPGHPEKKRAHDRRYRERKLAQNPQGYRERKRAQDRRYRERKRQNPEYRERRRANDRRYRERRRARLSDARTDAPAPESR